MSASMAIFVGALLVIAPFLALQFRMLQQSQALVGSTPSLPDGWAFLGQGRQVVWLHSSGCAPCRRMEGDVAPFFRSGKMVGVDVGRERHLAERLGVMATPTTVVLQDGEIVGVAVGVRELDELELLMAGEATPAVPSSLEQAA